MKKEKNSNEFYYCASYPIWVIGIRWLFFLLFFALSTYIAFLVKEQFAYLYVIYGAICLSLILPLSKCVNCYYYAKRCQCGWGKVAGYLFKRGTEEKFNHSFKFILLLYPLWIIPLILGFIQLLRKRTLFELILFLALLLILLLERFSKRKLGCRICFMRKDCPEVNPE